MAMTKCKECGQIVSEYAEVCPHCGIKRNAERKPVSNKPIVTCKPHPVVYVKTIIWGIIFFIIAMFFYHGGINIFATIILIADVIGVILFCLNQHAAYLNISDAGIIGKVGFIHIKQLSAPLSHVQNIELDAGVLGRTIGYANIKICTAGTGGVEYSFKHMTNAKQLKDVFLQKVQ